MTNDPYKPQTPLPVPEYARLVVVPKDSKKKPGQVIAFIDRQLCFFEKGAPTPPVGEPVEVMILRPLYNRKDEGYDFCSVFTLIIRVVTPDWTLIEHDGFECSGSMCRTTARMTGPRELLEKRNPDRKAGERIFGPWLTPGRSEIFEADNVNAGSTWNQPYAALRPGRAWVSTEKLLAGDFPLRIEGLARVEDGMYAHAVKKSEVKG